MLSNVLSTQKRASDASLSTQKRASDASLAASFVACGHFGNPYPNPEQFSPGMTTGEYGSRSCFGFDQHYTDGPVIQREDPQDIVVVEDSGGLADWAIVLICLGAAFFFCGLCGLAAYKCCGKATGVMNEFNEMAKKMGHDHDHDPANKIEVERYIVSPKDVTSAEIVGNQNLKEQLERILKRLKNPQHHTELTKPPKGILLHGPPGTGKTSIARWMADKAGFTFFSVDPSVLSSYHGVTEKTFQKIFACAEEKKPSIIFIDEVDMFLSDTHGHNDSHGHNHHSTQKNTLLQLMDGFKQHDGVLLIAATNRPWDIDKAALRRFGKRYLVGLPEEHERIEMFNRLKAKHKDLKLSEQDISALAKKLDGWNYSDILNLIKEAADIPEKEFDEKYPNDVTLDKKRPINGSDFTAALEDAKSSTEGMLEAMKEYEIFQQKNGLGKSRHVSPVAGA